MDDSDDSMGYPAFRPACVGKGEKLVDLHVKFDDSRIEVIELPDMNFSPGPSESTNVPTYSSYRKVKPVNKKRRVSGWFSYLVARYSAISMAKGIGFTHDFQGGPPLPRWEGVSRNTSDSILPKVPLLWYHRKCWIYTDYESVCLSGTGSSGPWRGEFTKLSQMLFQTWLKIGTFTNILVQDRK